MGRSRVKVVRRNPGPRLAASLEVMPLPQLCDRLETRQQVLLRCELARLEELIQAIIAKAERVSPQLRRLEKAFKVFRLRLIAHLRDEAQVVFPQARRPKGVASGKTASVQLLRRRAARWKQQHFEVDEAIAELRSLANEVAAASAASGQSRALRLALARFERLIHEQMYEENRFLFPRALTGRPA